MKHFSKMPTFLWILLKWRHGPCITPQQKSQPIGELLSPSPLESPTGEPVMRWIAWLFKFFGEIKRKRFCMRWHWIDQESCYDYDEAKGGGGRKNTRGKCTQVQEHVAHTDTTTASITFAWNYGVFKVPLQTGWFSFQNFPYCTELC